MRDRFLQSYGSNAAMQNIEPGLPNITGSLENILFLGTSLSPSSGALKEEFKSYHTTLHDPVGTHHGTVFIDASMSNSIYGQSESVQPPAYTVYYIIKVV